MKLPGTGGGGKVAGLLKDKKFQVAALAGAGLAGFAILRKRSGGGSGGGTTGASGTAGGIGTPGNPASYSDQGAGAYGQLQTELETRLNQYGTELGTLSDQLQAMQQGGNPAGAVTPPKPKPKPTKKPPAKKPPAKKPPAKKPTPPKHAPAPKTGGTHRHPLTPPHVTPPKPAAKKPATPGRLSPYKPGAKVATNPFARRR